MEPFKVGQRTYRAKRMDTFTQFHVARRVAPLVTSIGLAAASGNPIATLSSATQALSGLSDADSEYVIRTCLSVVETAEDANGTVWTPIYTPHGGLMRENEIGLVEMLQISQKVLEEVGVIDFFTVLQGLFQRGREAEKA